MRVQDVPPFDKLPSVKDMPQGCAWGLWDKNGVRDQCGTLNLLTPEVVLEAKQEIQKGISVAINWPMHNTTHPGFTRKPLEHKILPFPGAYAHDDEIAVNTQAGSQWDGFKHWAHQPSGYYYNGLAHKDVIQSSDNGIDHWTKKGGIIARGVLLDYVSYAQRHNISYDPWTRHEITVSELEDVAKEQGVEMKPADILIVRSGWVQRHDKAGTSERVTGCQSNHDHCGVKGCEETVRWLWSKHFAAIAGDAIAWEAWPPHDKEWAVHDWSLAMWGEPIGELWNLEELARVCQEQKRWSFFVASAPLNVEGGVATPPNALCVF